MESPVIATFAGVVPHAPVLGDVAAVAARVSMGRLGTPSICRSSRLVMLKALERHEPLGVGRGSKRKVVFKSHLYRSCPSRDMASGATLQEFSLTDTKRCASVGKQACEERQWCEKITKGYGLKGTDWRRDCDH